MSKRLSAETTAFYSALSRHGRWTMSMSFNNLPVCIGKSSDREALRKMDVGHEIKMA